MDSYAGQLIWLLLATCSLPVVVGIGRVVYCAIFHTMAEELWWDD